MTIINKQRPEPHRSAELGSLDVHSVFFTLQGEGPHSGAPSVFVRLAGCNLKCPLCDTAYTEGRRERTYLELRDEIRRCYVEAGFRKDLEDPKDVGILVVFTGGEPFRQADDLLHFLFWLQYEEPDWFVQIETNGMVCPEPSTSINWKALPPISRRAPNHKGTWAVYDFVLRQTAIVCSPKGKVLNRFLAPYVVAYKYVLSAGEVDAKDGLPTTTLGHKFAPARPPEGVHHSMIWVQPVDVQDAVANQHNQNAVLASAMRFGYNFSIQLHKHLGLD